MKMQKYNFKYEWQFANPSSIDQSIYFCLNLRLKQNQLESFAFKSFRKFTSNFQELDSRASWISVWLWTPFLKTTVENRTQIINGLIIQEVSV